MAIGLIITVAVLAIISLVLSLVGFGMFVNFAQTYAFWLLIIGGVALIIIFRKPLMKLLGNVAKGIGRIF